MKKKKARKIRDEGHQRQRQVCCGNLLQLCAEQLLSFAVVVARMEGTRRWHLSLEV
jgi:hypothetical protein